MRLTLAELAKAHAAARLPRKKRNAALRAAGYDPDGPDGERYRQLLHAEIYGRDVARGVGEMLAESPDRTLPDVTVLWRPAAADFAAAVAAGLIEAGDWVEYADRLSRAVRELTAAGHRVEVIEAPPAELLAVLAEHGLANDPPGRAAAINLLGRRRLTTDH